MNKIAVILFNLGGPDGPQAVKPFLFNLFNDPAIIRLPRWLRYLAATFLSARREKTARGMYDKIGGASPLLENTWAQARALERSLGDLGWTRCFVSMRYAAPFAADTVAEVAKFSPDLVILLPLYPHYSTTTSASSLRDWYLAAAQAGLDVPAKTICCYPDEPGFIAALVERIRASYAEAESYGHPRVLFSAHGLPEKIIRKGDPYVFQCARTAESLVRALDIDELDAELCYQSRVGPLTWIGPAADQEVRRAAREKIPLVVVPIGFVSEHVETLVEIDMGFRALALAQGAPFFAYTGAVGVMPAFIEGLADLVRKAATSEADCVSLRGKRICPPEFSGCCQKKD